MLGAFAALLGAVRADRAVIAGFRRGSPEVYGGKARLPAAVEAHPWLSRESPLIRWSPAAAATTVGP
ncbi:hypothetical protein Ani05nite_22210 [Amorphoplanes nipponensis]|uniref:Uncharacterized protein n=1 Tax=Actinoplanes nipponensis TaxID=135950 RepID=A0A919JGM5_9ACTN|nr:hypothetical protein Ani05nite_22210 [Actinoplanes nipponensis]